MFIFVKLILFFCFDYVRDVNTASFEYGDMVGIC